jgi:hypothetical protein
MRILRAFSRVGLTQKLSRAQCGEHELGGFGALIHSKVADNEDPPRLIFGFQTPTRNSLVAKGFA